MSQRTSAVFSFLSSKAVPNLNIPGCDVLYDFDRATAFKMETTHNYALFKQIPLALVIKSEGLFKGARCLANLRDTGFTQFEIKDVKADMFIVARTSGKLAKIKADDNMKTIYVEDRDEYEQNAEFRAAKKCFIPDAAGKLWKLPPGITKRSNNNLP